MTSNIILIGRRDNKLKLNFKIKNKIILIGHKKFCKKFSVHDVIKFTKKEFDLLELKYTKKNFYHFNMYDSGHKKNSYYLIIKILKKGRSRKNKHTQPILSFKKFYLAKCFYTKKHISYQKLKYFNYEKNLFGLKSIEKLKENILLKYSTSMTHLSKKQKVALGVSITKLRVLKKYENF